MQIARQVYGIITAENGLCFTKDGQTVYITKSLDKYMALPELTIKLVGNSFLNDKMKRKYLRIVNERVKRFIRKSED